MNIAEQFNSIAEEYDSGRRKFIPCFDDYYDKTTDFVASVIEKPKKILDLGAGTGLLTSYWYKHFPESEYMLTDIANEMLKVARLRFDRASNVEFQVSDYREKLPETDIDTIISALSIHHLENEEKRVLFQRIYEKLPNGGVFVNYDQFCGETDYMSREYDSYWVQYLESNGLSQDELEKWRERRQLDRECSTWKETEMLKTAGFQLVENVFSMQKFSVIMAVKCF